MWNKKKVGFLIFSTIFILGLMPVVFALLEPLYYLGSMDFVDLYLQNRGWLDPIVLTALFCLIFQTLTPRVFGGDDEESKSTAQKLAIILGIVAGLGVTFLARSYGPPEGPILGYAWIWIPFLILLVVLYFYKYFKKDDKEELSIGTIVFILAISLFLISLLAGNYIKNFPLLKDIISYGFIFSGAILAAALIIWFFSKLSGWIIQHLGGAEEPGGGRGKRGDNGNGGHRGGDGGDNGHGGRGEPPEEEPIKHKPLRVIINVLNDDVPHEKKTYSPGDEITLLARIEEKEGFFSWKPVTENFACAWRINNLPHQDHNRDIRIQIPQLSAVEQQLFFSVEVQSIDHPERTAEADDYIVVRADIPKIIITDPVNTNKKRDLKARIDQVLNFSYGISGAHPQEIEDVVWIFKKGVVSKTLTDSINERDLASTKIIGKGSPSLSFESLGAEPGVYSIICAAVTKNGGYYRVELTKQIVADYFILTLEKKEREEPPEPPTPPEPPETEPKFYLNVLEGTVGSPKKAQPISKTNKDLSFSTEIGKYYMLQPIVENGDIKSYDIEITSDVKSDEKFVYSKQKRIGYYMPKTPGTKKINCVFKDPKKRIRKEKLNINIKINVKGTPPIPPGTETKFYLEVTRANKKDKSAVKESFSEKESTLEGTLDEFYLFEPYIENGDLNDYYVEIRSDTKSPDKFSYSDKTKNAALETEIVGTKKIICIFQSKDKGISAEITINIKVSPPGTPPKEFVEITSPIIKKDSEKNPKVILFGEIVEFKANSSPQIEVEWYLVEGHGVGSEKVSGDKGIGVGSKLEYAFRGTIRGRKISSGKYTIIAFGYKGKTNEAVAGDYIFIELISQPVKPKANFLLNVFDKNKKGIASSKTDFSLAAYTDENYSFFPIVEGDDIKNYNVNLTADGRDPFRYDQKRNFGVILTKSLGKKRVTATFSKDKTILATITATIEVKPKVKPKPEIKIIRINGENVKTGSVINTSLGKALTLEAEINDPALIDYFYWSVKEGSKPQEGLGREPTKGKNANLFVYPPDYFKKYFEKGKKYMVIVNGEKGELFSKKGGFILKDEKGDPVIDYVYIQT